MEFRSLIELIGRAVDLAGVGIIVVGIVIVALQFLVQRVQRTEPEDSYRTFRQGLGRAILLGLEVLVAADIIRTVAVEPTLQNVAVLGVVVVIRTFLSWSLEVELTGRFPWQPEKSNENASVHR